MEKIKSHISLQLGITFTGLFLFLIGASIFEMRIISISLALFGSILVFLGMVSISLGLDYRKKQNCIKQININLKELKYTEEEISDRQNYLNRQSFPKLVDINRTLENEINYLDDDFYSPIKRNIRRWFNMVSLKIIASFLVLSMLISVVILGAFALVIYTTSSYQIELKFVKYSKILIRIEVLVICIFVILITFTFVLPLYILLSN